MKKILFTIACFTIFISFTKALNYRGCDSKYVSDLKAFVNNVNISYNYTMQDGMPVFSVTINNITPDMYFIDSKRHAEYHYYDTNNGEIVLNNYYNGDSGTYKFYSARGECYGLTLGSKYYSFPTYNNYYGGEICKGNENLNVCKKWISVNYNSDELEQLIYEYKNPKKEEFIIEHSKTWVDYIIEFYIKYYLYILISIVVVCGIIIIVKRKKDKFKF